MSNKVYALIGEMVRIGGPGNAWYVCGRLICEDVMNDKYSIYVANNVGRFTFTAKRVTDVSAEYITLE